MDLIENGRDGLQGESHRADEALIALEHAQTRERLRREALPVADLEAFERSCTRSDQLEEEMLGIRAEGRSGIAVKFRELVYALRHAVPVEPWIDSLRRDLEDADALRGLAAGLAPAACASGSAEAA